MKLFRKGSSAPQFTKYKSEHFFDGAKRILWKDEKILIDGFFVHGPDPFGQEDFSDLALAFGGNPHTYVAVTPWRVILGYLANGTFSSHEYFNTEPIIRQIGQTFHFTYSNPLLKASGSSESRSTYIVSKEVADCLNSHLDGERPSVNEKTKINLARKSWGEGPLAALARAKSGRDYMPIEMCVACGAINLVPDDIEDFPEKGNIECEVCLRVRANN